MKKSFVLTLILLLTFALVGCTVNLTQPSPKDPAVDPKPSQETISFKLYFSDQQAMYLKEEERTVTKGPSVAEIMVNELIKGPNLQNAVATLPKETKLLSLEITSGIAYVNFSKEVQTNHWGGSAQDLMTVFSVVNTLTQLPEIKKVQFLVAGEKQEAIWGHYYTMEPIAPDLNRIAPTEGQPQQPTQSEEPNQPREPQQPLPTNEENQLKPGDYFPMTLGSTWQFLGDGNEYASFNREVLYAQDNKGQIKEDNGGTVSTSVYEITADAVTQVYFSGEDYEPKNMLKQPSNRNVIILKAPLKPGTKWTTENSTREIAEVNTSVNTPAGKFENCIKILITQDHSTMYEYYKKGIGLVKREFMLPKDKVTSILGNYTLK